MGKNAAYAAQYAEEAKEQMRMYGIPASVILAQAILESSNGQSRLALNENNHFGIRANCRANATTTLASRLRHRG